MNRLDRVTAILIQLQSKKIVKAQDMADRLKISLRSIYRDIKTLEEAGIPILGEAGVGYSIMEGYRIPPVMFTREEATAFLTAGKLMEKFSDESTEANYKSALYKVKAVLKNTEKDLLENMEDHIEVIKNYPFRPGSSNNTIPILLKSISDKLQVQVHYAAFNTDEITIRNIEPFGIFYTSGYWHVIAFCCLRNDYRDFRTDRITQIKSTDTLFNKKHPSLKTYLANITKEQQLETVVISIAKKTGKYLQEQKYYYGFVSEKIIGDKMEMTFLTSSLESFARWYLMFADEAEIIEPAPLKKILKDFVSLISKKLK